MELPDTSRLLELPAATWKALGDRLHQIGLDGACVARVAEIGGRRFERMRRPMRNWHLRRLPDLGGLAMRMFMFEDPVTHDEAARVLGEIPVGALLDAGALVRADGDRVVAPLRAHLAHDKFIFTDDLERGSDVVMGCGELTVALCRAARPTRRVRSVLDMGCGAGTAGLMFASSADRVVGVDINPRAVTIARVNAQLNGITNAEFRVGDAFAPVAGETFDLIVSQPPYIPMPAGATAVTFLYGGARGDEFALSMLAQAPRYLSPTGRVVFMVQYPVTGGETGPVAPRVRAVVPDDDIALLMIEQAGTDLDEYCIRLASALHSDLGPAYAADAVRRREHFAQLDVTDVYTALTVLQRTPQRPAWTATLRLESMPPGTLVSSRVDTLISARETLAGGDEAVLAATVRFPEGATFAERQSSGKTVIAMQNPLTALAPNVELPPAQHRILALLADAPSVRAGVEAFAKLYRARYKDAVGKVLVVAKEAIEQGVLQVLPRAASATP